MKKFLAALGLVLFFNSANGDPLQVSDRARAEIDALVKSGKTNLLVFDKPTNVLSIVEGGRLTQGFYAVSGKIQRDDFEHGLSVTPPGLYNLDINGGDIVFYRHGRETWLIHPLVNTGQAAFNRFEISKNPKDLRVSGGCISLRKKDLDIIMSFASRYRIPVVEFIDGRIVAKHGLQLLVVPYKPQ